MNEDTGWFQFQTGSIRRGSAHLGAAFRQFSFNSRLVRLEVADLKQIGSPCIGFNSRLVRLEEKEFKRIQRRFNSFNSRLVRLEVFPKVIHLFYWSLMVRVKSFLIPLIFHTSLPSIGGRANSLGG